MVRKCLFVSLLYLTFAFATPIYKNASAQETKEQAIARANSTTVTVITGDIHSTAAKLTQDMAVMFNRDAGQRVLPLLGLDSVSCVSDVLHLRGVDIGIVHQDSLEMLGRKQAFPNIKQRLQYITKLFQDKIYIIASSSITNVNELANKPVNFGPGGLSPYTTPALLFKALKIKVQRTSMYHEQAIENIKSGKIAATVIVGGGLEMIANKLQAEDDLQLLPIPLPKGQTVYTPEKLTSKEYPELIPADKSLGTVSVPLVMVVNRWSNTHKRYQKVARFIEALFSKFDRFRDDLYLPQWKNINLAARLPNWTRFPPAQSWLKTRLTASSSPLKRIQKEFSSFLAHQTVATNTQLTDGQKKEMFDVFLKWPKNPVKAKITVRMTSNTGVGKVIGTVTASNAEILVAGRKEGALLLKPELKGLAPGRHAFHIHQNPECGPAEENGVMVPGLAGGTHLRLSGTGELSGTTFQTYLGNLPDVQVDADGWARRELVAPRLTLADIANRSLMIHKGQDDGSPRLACGAVK